VQPTAHSKHVDGDLTVVTSLPTLMPSFSDVPAPQRHPRLPFPPKTFFNVDLQLSFFFPHQMTAALILENDHRRRQEGRRRANIGVGGLREILEMTLQMQ